MTLVRLERQLRLERCPFCNVDRPNLTMIFETQPQNSEGIPQGIWRFYQCGRCGGVTTAWAKDKGLYTEGVIPSSQGVSRHIPNRANVFLSQAQQSLHAPAGAIMLAASSIDAMLKEKGYTDGNLYPRIEQAAKDHLITEGMARWAHQVRLDANAQRHADEGTGLPTSEEARKAINFAQAFGEFLFVLPAMVEQGLEETAPKESNQ